LLLVLARHRRRQSDQAPAIIDDWIGAGKISWHLNKASARRVYSSVGLTTVDRAV
jgi:hypothetical protein